MTTDNQIRKVLNQLDKSPKQHRINLNSREIYGLGYKPLIETKANFIVMKGSRNSKKSVNNFRRAVLKLIGKVMGTDDPNLKCNVLVIRKYLTDHSGSTRKEIVKAIKALGLSHLFRIPKSELTITYIPKGTCFFFRGMAGGAHHQSAVVCLGVADHVGNGSVVGKVDDDVGVGVTQFRKGSGDAVFTVQAYPGGDFAAQDAVNELAHGAVGAAENGSHLSTPSRLISRRSIPSFCGSIWVRGRRSRFSQ